MSAPLKSLSREEVAKVRLRHSSYRVLPSY